MVSAAELTKQGIAAYNAGNRAAAADLFQQATQADSRYEMAWLWRASTAETDAAKRTFLEQALAVNPSSAPARRGLAQLGTEVAVPAPPEPVEAAPVPVKATPPIIVSAPREPNRRWLAIAAAVLVVVVLAGAGYAVMQSGMGTGISAASQPTLIPTPSCVQESVAFVAQVEPLAREWDDANKLADSTPRASLPGQIDKLQAIRRRVQDMQAPDCAFPTRKHLIDAMDNTINGYIAFLGQKPDTAVTVYFTQAGRDMDDYKKALEAIK